MKKPLTIRLDEAVYDQLKATADTMDRSMAYVSEKAILLWLEDNASPQLSLDLIANTARKGQE